MLRTHPIRFHNRIDAGQQLASLLRKYKGQDVVVYALPRGGVVLGAEVVRVLDAPLDLLIPRKVGHPMNPEFALCAVTEDGTLVCSEHGQQYIRKPWFQELLAKEIDEAKRRRETYLAGRQPISAQGKTAIIIDDGVATGLTMLAAIEEVKKQQPKKIMVAVPVAPPDIARQLKKHVDELVAVTIPNNYLGAVGAYYESFPPVSDEEVVKLLQGQKAKTPS